jgi:hypothetical protein
MWAGSGLRDERNGGDDRMTTYEIIMVVLTGIGLLITAFKANGKR